MLRILCFSLGLFCIVFQSARAGEPCTEYTVITDDTRAANAKLDWTTTNPYTDDRLHKQWYRIQNEVGEEIATSPPGVFMCSTWYPIWMNGSFPVSENNTVTHNVCLQTFKSSCDMTWTIRIKRCPGDYLVYELEPSPVIDSGYCFGWAELCQDGYSSETGFSPGCSNDYPHIVLEPKVQTKLVDGIEFQLELGPSLMPVFECHIPTISSAYVYDIYWYIDNYSVVAYRNKDFTEINSTFLLPKDWVNSHSMNMKVKCSVRVRNAKNTTPSPHQMSSLFTAGIIVENQIINVTEGQDAFIKLRSTVPSGCISRKMLDSCNLTVHIIQSPDKERPNTLINNVQPGELAFAKQTCGILIPTSNWNQQIEMSLTGYVDNFYNMENPRTAFIQFKAVEAYRTPIIFGKHQNLTTIKVNIFDADRKTSGRSCMSFAGSSFMPIDGQLYSFLGSGEFILYRHKSHPYSVHLLQTACGLSSVCSCGIAVRSYNSLFVYRTCDKITQQYVAQEMTVPVTKISKCRERDMNVEKSSTGYKITLPSGTLITIRKTNKWIQNILIKPSILDAEQTEGLCGHMSYNGNSSGYFQMRNNIQSSDTLLFANSWRVTDENEKLFVDSLSMHVYHQPLKTYCTCRKQAQKYPFYPSCPNNACNLTHPVQIDYSGLRTNRYNAETGCGDTRKKQTLEDNSDDITVVVPLTYDELYNPDFIPNLEWKNGWNEISARNSCETVISRISSTSFCNQYTNLNKTIFISGCISGIKASGSVNVTDWLSGAIQDYCYAELSRNETFLAMKTSNGTILESLLNHMCPNDCNGRGTCEKGKCHCDAGYVGRGCKWNIINPPRNILLPDKGLCKKTQRTCRRTNIFGDFRNTTIICRLQNFKITKNGKVDGIIKTFTDAEYKNDYTVSCPLQSERRKRATDILAVGYHISLSYDGSHFGDNVSLITYDDNCVSCNEELFTCTYLARCEATSYPLTTKKSIENNDDDKSNELDDDDDENDDHHKHKNKESAISAVVGILAILCAVMIFVIGFVIWKKCCRSKQSQNKLAVYNKDYENTSHEQNIKPFNTDIFTTSGIYPDDSPPPYSSRRESMCSQLSAYNGWTYNGSIISSPPPYSSRSPSFSSLLPNNDKRA